MDDNFHIEGTKKKLKDTGWVMIILGVLFIAVGLFVCISGIAGFAGGGIHGGGGTFEVLHGSEARLWGVVLIGMGIYLINQGRKDTIDVLTDEPTEYKIRK